MVWLTGVSANASLSVLGFDAFGAGHRAARERGARTGPRRRVGSRGRGGRGAARPGGGGGGAAGRGTWRGRRQPGVAGPGEETAGVPGPYNPAPPYRPPNPATNPYPEAAAGPARLPHAARPPRPPADRAPAAQAPGRGPAAPAGNATAPPLSGQPRSAGQGRTRRPGCPQGGTACGAGAAGGYGGSTMTPSPLPPAGQNSDAGQSSDVPTLLVKIFGKDRPGITAGLFDTLAAYAVDVVDIEQVVSRGRLVLCALVTEPTVASAGELRATVHSWAESLKLQAEIISGIGDNRPRGSGRSHVTVLGHPLTAESTAAIAAQHHRRRRQHRPHLPARQVPGHGRGVRRVRRGDRRRCAPRSRPRRPLSGWTWPSSRRGCTGGPSGSS